jgi:hypothetical protein
LNGGEIEGITSRCNLGIILMVSDPSYIPLIVSQIYQVTAGLTLSVHDNSFIHSYPSPLKLIPSGIKTLSQADEWIDNQNFEQLDNINYNNYFVVLSLNHSSTDEIVIANLISILGKKVLGLYLLIFFKS